MLAYVNNRKSKDHGFTLIELLVVIIIIGILAAVAIPLYLNQQKTARDAATISDVKNMATTIQDNLTALPDAFWFGAGSANGGFNLRVGVDATNQGAATFVPATKGTRMRIEPHGKGAFTIYAYNPNGKVYNSPGSVISYWSANGGLKRDAMDVTGSSFGEAQ